MATFSLDEDQRQIQDAMARFAAGKMRPIARECDEAAHIPDDFLARSWELGLAANIIPEDYGGYACPRSVLNNAIMAEELAYGDLSLAAAVMAPYLGILPILEMGGSAQKERYLPAFCGETYTTGTLALMEHRTGFAAKDIRTTAAPDGGRYVINGGKCLAPMADKAGYFCVIANTGAQGVQAFLVDRDQDGLSIGPREQNMGLNALDTRRITLSNCSVTAEQRLENFSYERLIALARIALAASATGVARASLDYCVHYAKERVTFGQPIATRQSIAFMLADMAIEIECTRLLTWKAAWRADQPDDSQSARQAYLAKQYAAEQSFKIADSGVSILGGHGLIREHPVELWFRDARAFSMLEGLVMA